MNRSLSKIVLYLLTFLLVATVLSAQEKPISGEGAAGEWLGALDVGAVKLRLALHVEKKDDGSLGAVLDSIDQNAKIPVDTAVFEGRTLRLTLKAIGGSYEGTLSVDGSSLQGTWSQGGQSLPLTFNRQEKAFALNRPQEPKAPFPYTSREVTFQSAAGDVRLAGTLLLPPGEGPFPAVALVTGSGAQDRDESLMGHKPFLVIADALARRGIASLRWDDRGAGASTGDHMGSSMEDFAADTPGPPWPSCIPCPKWLGTRSESLGTARAASSLQWSRQRPSRQTNPWPSSSSSRRQGSRCGLC